MTKSNSNIKLDNYKYGFSKPDTSVFRSKKGLNKSVVEEISSIKGEPKWMRKFRLKALKRFESRPVPAWGANLSDINFNNITYYVKPSDRQERSWDDVPKEIKDTYDKIGIPQVEKKLLAGVGAQYDSEVIYKSVLKELEDRGVVFMSMDEGLKNHPEIVRQYFGTVVPINDNKFAALNSAVWSGGSFVYIPKGIHVKLPLQAYFRINSKDFGQFERTLIVAEEGSRVSYLEGCSAPIYTTDSLHAAVVEVIVKKGAGVRYTTVQNWSNNVYNLVTKRAKAYGESAMEWVDCNIGSKVSMKYPSVYLMEPGARGEMLSLAYADFGQHQDVGAKMIHAAPNTSSRITSKSVSVNGGRASYRGLLEVMPGAKNSKSRVECDALILDPESRTDTYPTMKINEDKVNIEHEATVSRVGEEQLFYLMSRGVSESGAMNMVVSGFIEPIVKELPLEYAVEMNRLIKLDMSNGVG